MTRKVSFQRPFENTYIEYMYVCRIGPHFQRIRDNF